MSQIKVDSIVPSGGIPAGADGGGIIQVVVGTNNTFSTTTSTSFIDFITATITPRSTDSKILCLVSAYASHLNSDQGDLILTRSNTQIYPTSSNITSSSYNNSIGIREWTEWNAVPTTMTYIDSPSTTSATTYKVRVRMNAANAVYLNRSRSVNTSGFGHGYYAESVLVLMEVSG